MDIGYRCYSINYPSCELSLLDDYNYKIELEEQIKVWEDL